MVRDCLLARFTTFSVTRFSRYATSFPSGENAGWNSSASVATTVSVFSTVAAKKYGSSLRSIDAV